MSPEPSPATQVLCRRASASLVAALLLVLPSFTPGAGLEAAEVTSVSPKWKGDLEILYRGGIRFTELKDRRMGRDAFTGAGRFIEVDQGMRLRGGFSVWHGLELRATLPLTFIEARRWLEAGELIYDPAAGAPTSASGQQLPDSVLEGSSSARHHVGPGDLSFGVRFLPFAESGVPGRVGPASMALDVEVFAPSGENHDAYRADGTAGPGWGGPQVRLGLSGSRRFGLTEPFVQIAYIHRAAYKEDLSGSRIEPSSDTDEEGLTELDPSDEFSLRFGAELIAAEDRSKDTSFRLLLDLGLTYIGPNQISSGTLLPAPLAATQGHRATTSEHVEVDVGFGMRLRPKADGEFYLDFDAAWISPHTLERVDNNAYSLSTAGANFRLRWMLGGRVRFR